MALLLLLLVGGSWAPRVVSSQALFSISPSNTVPSISSTSLAVMDSGKANSRDGESESPGSSLAPESKTSQEVSSEKSFIYPETSSVAREPVVPVAASSQGSHIPATMTSSPLVTPAASGEPSGHLITTVTSTSGTSPVSRESMPMMATPKAPEGTLSFSRPAQGSSGFPVTMAMSTVETTRGTSETPVTMATSSVETSSETSGTPISRATNSVETPSGSSGTPITIATSSVETKDGTRETPITMATSTVETPGGSSGIPITMATSTVETPGGSSGIPITMATSSSKTSNEMSGFPTTMASSSVETTSATNGHPITVVPSSLETSGTRVETAVVTTKEPSGNTSVQPEMGGMMLVAMLVAVLVVILLLALLLFWRRRQKRRTGVLTLSTSGKYNGAVDAWAGPVRVADEEAVLTIAGESGGPKASGTPEVEESGQLPTLSTFFGRRKSRQSSVALEEFRPGSGPGPMGEEEEPLVGCEEEAADAPTSNGPAAGPGAEPPRL